MSSPNPVKEFLEKKLKPKQDPSQKIDKNVTELKRKEFAEKSGIPYSTVNRLLTKDYLSPNITTIFAIAKYFGCSMDEVIGKEKSDDKPIYNIRAQINEYIQKNPQSLYKLSEQLGFSEHVIPDFVKPGSIKEINGDVVIAFAKHTNKSLDEVVGRSEPSVKKSIGTKLAEDVQKVKETLKSHVTSTIPAKESNKPSSFAERVRNSQKSKTDPGRGL